jgi:DNA-binding CsgD family transcriptional regulator
MESRYGLTDQELQVVREVVFGFTDREIAGRLRMSEENVRHHLTLILDKTGTSTRVELAKLMLKHEVTFGLTDLQLQIVREVLLGHSNREIAEKLKIGEDEVKYHHLCSIFDKTGVSTRLELALLFHEL